MIQFDNGPAGGDYVRYIERLVAGRLLIPAMKQGEGLPVGAPGPTTVDAPSDRAPAPRLAPTKANAIAARLTIPSRDAGQVLPSAVDFKALLDVLGIVVGAAIALFGFFSPKGALLFVFIGIALMFSRFKHMIDTRAQGSVAAEAPVARPTFGGPPRNP